MAFFRGGQVAAGNVQTRIADVIILTGRCGPAAVTAPDLQSRSRWFFSWITSNHQLLILIGSPLAISHIRLREGCRRMPVPTAYSTPTAYRAIDHAIIGDVSLGEKEHASNRLGPT